MGSHVAGGRKSKQGFQHPAFEQRTIYFDWDVQLPCAAIDIANGVSKSSDHIV
jgi:hypothetical protein